MVDISMSQRSRGHSKARYGQKMFSILLLGLALMMFGLGIAGAALSGDRVGQGLLLGAGAFIAYILARAERLIRSVELISRTGDKT